VSVEQHQVPPEVALDPIGVAIAQRDAVVTGSGEHRVRAATRVDAIRPARAVERVRTRASPQLVGARLAAAGGLAQVGRQPVLTAAADQEIRARAARDQVSRGITGQPVGAAPAGQVLGVGGDPVALTASSVVTVALEVGAHRRPPGAIVHVVLASPAAQGV
jgi:hypothetical protein